MFLGHYAVALALKRAEPKLSLGTLFLAVQLCDLLWGAFLLLGWEHVRIITDGSSLLPLEFYDYPISHSLVGTIIWSGVAAALYYSWPTRDTSRHWQAAALVGLAVFSHFVLDLLVHLPDLPLSGNDSPKLGLGLWNSVPATLALEFARVVGTVSVSSALCCRVLRKPVVSWTSAEDTRTKTERRSSACFSDRTGGHRNRLG